MPPKLCYHALELSSDNADRAANWLQDNGATYMAVMGSEKTEQATVQPSSAATQQSAASDEAILDDVDKSPPLIDDSMYSKHVSSVVVLDDADAEEPREAKEEEAAAAADAGAAGGAAVASATAAAPSEPQGAAEITVKSLMAVGGAHPAAQLRDRCLVVLRTSNTSSGAMHEIGVPAEVNVSTISRDRLMVRTRAPDGTVTKGEVALDQCRLISHFYGHPVFGIKDLAAIAAATEAAVAIHEARRTLLSLMVAWPANIPLTVAEVGGPRRFLDLAKMIAGAENIFSSSSSEVAAQSGGLGLRAAYSPLMDVMKAQLRYFLRQDAVLAATSGGSVFNAAGAMSSKTTRRTCGSVAEQVVHDVAWNVMEATSPGDTGEVITFESLHPHFHNCSYSGKVQIEGAKAMWISFDPRSALAGHQSNCYLKFSTDKKMRKPIKVCTSQDSKSWKPFVVHSNTVYFKFYSSVERGEGKWGYMFHASPLRGLQWLNERQVLEDPSLEWSMWLLQFLLSDVQQLAKLGAVHNGAIFNSLVQYLRSPGSPYKGRIISVLTHLLENPQQFPQSSPPDFALVSRLASVVLSAAQNESSGRVFLPVRLQRLIEFVTSARAAEAVWTRQMPPLQPIDLHRDVKTSVFGAPKLSQPVNTSALGKSVNSMQPDECLLEVRTMVQCFSKRARFPDHILCFAVGWSAGLSVTSSSIKKLKEKQFIPALRAIVEVTPEGDRELIHWASEAANAANRDLFTCTASDLAFLPKHAQRYPLLSSFPDSMRLIRFGFLLAFNDRLRMVLHLIDATNTDDPYSMGYQLRQLDHCIFPDTKKALIDKAIELTWTPGNCLVTCNLDNNKRFRNVERNKVDISVSENLFCQGFRQLYRESPKTMRHRLDDRERLFTVSFSGERGIDWGGLFR